MGKNDEPAEAPETPKPAAAEKKSKWSEKSLLWILAIGIIILVVVYFLVKDARIF